MAISTEKRAYYEKLFPREEMIIGGMSGDTVISEEDYDAWLELQPEPAVHAAREDTETVTVSTTRRIYYPSEQAQIHALTDMAATLSAAGVDIGAKMKAVIDKIAEVKAKYPKSEGADEYPEWIEPANPNADGTTSFPELPD